MKTLLFAISLLFFAILMLSVKVLFVKGGRFPFHNHGGNHNSTDG